MTAQASVLRLGVNIDHAATLRQARYPGRHESPLAEPRLLEIALACKEGGADSLTVHLREDRRHVQESDVRLLAKERPLPLNLEMAADEAVAAIAVEIAPDDVCIVPERRAEVTTEGGLDAAGRAAILRPLVSRLQAAGSRVSLFIDPDLRQVVAAAEIGAEAVELHTGAFSNHCLPDGSQEALASAELARLCGAARRAHALGLQVNAGHGINYFNIRRILGIPHLSDLNIGHSIICRALTTGVARAVAEMKRAMSCYKGGLPENGAEGQAR